MDGNNFGVATARCGGPEDCAAPPSPATSHEPQLQLKIVEPILSQPTTRHQPHRDPEPLSFIRRHLLLLLATVYVIAIFFPQLGQWFRAPFIEHGNASPVHLLLGTLLFALGLSTPWNRIGDLLQNASWLGLSMVIRFFLFLIVVLTMPLLPTSLAVATVGFLLLLAMPAAASSSAWCIYLGSSQSLCLALIAGTTLASVVTAPMLLRVGVAMAPTGTTAAMASLVATCELKFVLAWVLGPMLLGMTICTGLPTIAKRLQQFEHQSLPWYCCF